MARVLYAFFSLNNFSLELNLLNSGLKSCFIENFKRLYLLRIKNGIRFSLFWKRWFLKQLIDVLGNKKKNSMNNGVYAQFRSGWRFFIIFCSHNCLSKSSELNQWLLFPLLEKTKFSYVYRTCTTTNAFIQSKQMRSNIRCSDFVCFLFNRYKDFFPFFFW